MPVLHLTNRTSTNIHLAGDKGSPVVSLPYAHTAEVELREVDQNDLFCSSLISLVNSSSLYVRLNSSTGHILSVAELTALKEGSLILDVDGNGIVENSEGMARVVFNGVDLKDAVTEYTATLPGSGSGRFHPQRYYFLCTDDDALNADATVNLGTTTGGTEYLAGQALTGLDTTDQLFRVDVAATTAATIADNATLYLSVASADSGTAGTIKVVVEGVLL